tara:strand:+ start:94 stop:1434 length:1341 start_codon:yes stop_codon:yes gene_type:complete
MIGFETIGNATLTLFDDEPVLTTDPWVYGNPYFGSWGHKYQIPIEQLNNIKKSKYIWLSHGHPDHIDPDSFSLFEGKTILLADHYNKRIFNDLSKKYKCVELKSNKWFEITKNIRIKSFSDWNQDSSLIVEILKKDLIFNLNDGQALGWSKEIKKIISNYKNKFLLRLISWGDADMINFYNHNDDFVMPLAAEKKPCGETYSYNLKKWGCNFILPFSSMHRYVRNDSIKMNKFITPLKFHYEKFDNKHGEMLPAFIKWNSSTNDYEKINPKENLYEIRASDYYGDQWSDELETEDKIILKKYFSQFDHLKKKFGFISFFIGNKEFNIKLSDRNEGIQFETPRNSLIYSVKNNIFDDLLIGNFMKTKLINVPSLYPDFTPYVTKYGDNGKVYSNNELKKYFDYYKFNSANYWTDSLKIKSETYVRAKLGSYKSIYYLARSIRRLIPF